MSSVSSRHRFQWSLARRGLVPSAMVPGCWAHSYQLLFRSPPSICREDVAVPIMSLPSGRKVVGEVGIVFSFGCGVFCFAGAWKVLRLAGGLDF